MAQLFVDGFDNYSTPSNIWDTVGGSPVIQNTSPSPRFTNPAGCVSQYLSVGSSATVKKNLPNTVTIISGFAFQCTTLTGSTRDIMNLQDTGTIQVGLVVNNVGALRFYRGGAAGTPIGVASANSIISTNIWYELAIVVTIDPSAGAVTCYLNGNSTPIINSTGLNTRATANTFCNQLLLNSMGTGNNYFDDVYIWDTTTGTQNAWPGNDARILTKLPTSAGDYTNWTPNGLGTNWQCNAQNPPNTSDYVSNNTPGTKDSYTTTAAGLTATPYSVTVRQSIYKDDANTHTAQALIRSSSVDGLGTAFNVNASPTFVDTVFTSDPNTSSPWTGAAADAAQIGVVETS